MNTKNRKKVIEVLRRRLLEVLIALPGTAAVPLDASTSALAHTTHTACIAVTAAASVTEGAEPSATAAPTASDIQVAALQEKVSMLLEEVNRLKRIESKQKIEIERLKKL